MGRLHPWIDGRPMGEFAPFGGVEYTEEWLHGCTEASWQTTPGQKHGHVRNGALVELRDAGWSVWSGILSEPGVDGTLYARGLWSQAATVAALDGSGNASYIPDEAIDNAIARGAIDWRREISLSATPIMEATDTGAPGVLMLADLLDKWSEKTGERWGVNGRREVYRSAWPSVATWQVSPGTAPLTPADDDIANVLVGRFLNALGTFETVSVSDTLSRDLWGTREVPVDLTGEKWGVLDASGAIAILNGLLASGVARMGWAEAIECHKGELLTMGGTPGRSIVPGEGVRVVGAYDPTALSAPTGYTEIAAARVVHRADGSLVIEPAGLAARGFQAALSAALAT